MNSSAITIDGVWKKFRLYHEKNKYLKSTVLRGKRARYEDFWAVRDVSFEIPSGSTFGIIGSNGSGKSTLLKCLAGILVPDKGAISINGRLSALLELGAGFHPELSGRENVYLNGAILGMTSRDIDLRLNDIIEFAGLGTFIDNPVRSYSSGMVVRLGFAIAANVEPEILLIDEVLAVGDASFQQRCYEKIEQFRHDGRTILLVSHGLSQITALCDDVAWLDKGELREVGPSYKVVPKYSGVSLGAQNRVDSLSGSRWGSGEVTVRSVDLLDNEDTVQETFTSGHPMTIRVHYTANVQVDDLVVGLRISHMHGLPMWGSNTKRSGVKLAPIPSQGYVDFEISVLPLLEGAFDLTIALSDNSEVNPYDYLENMYRFHVVQGSRFDEGAVSFLGHWRINAAD